MLATQPRIARSVGAVGFACKGGGKGGLVEVGTASILGLREGSRERRGGEKGEGSHRVS